MMTTVVLAMSRIMHCDGPSGAPADEQTRPRSCQEANYVTFVEQLVMSMAMFRRLMKNSLFTAAYADC